MNWFLRNRYIFPMISIIFENRISFSKIGIKKLRKKNILSSCDINANIISRNFTEYSIYSPVRISHAKDARINNFSTLLFYLKIIFYFTILKILCYSRTIKQIWMQICTTLDASFDHAHTHTHGWNSMAPIDFSVNMFMRLVERKFAFHSRCATIHGEYRET